MKNQLIMIAVLLIGLTACDGGDEEVMMIDTSMPQGEFTADRSGTFVENAAPSQGMAELGVDSEENTFLRFGSDFDTNLGTGTVTVFLSTSNMFEGDPGNGNPNLFLVGPVRNAGENFFKIPEGTNTDKYSHVLLWCGSAAVLFGNAELQ